MGDELFPRHDGKILTSDIDYVDVWRVRAQTVIVFLLVLLSVADRCRCLQGMEALQASGKVKSIGVSNFSILQLERLLALCRVPPAVNQVLQKETKCSSNKIKSQSVTMSLCLSH